MPFFTQGFFVAGERICYRSRCVHAAKGICGRHRITNRTATVGNSSHLGLSERTGAPGTANLNVRRESQMRIESARELKQEIKSGYLSRLGTEDSDRQRLGVRAHISEGSARPRTIALGITARKSGPEDHKLAVRVQHPLLWNREEVDKIRRQAAGEVDVRYIGQVRPLRASASQGKCRPLCLGCSIGHFQITAGSL